MWKQYKSIKSLPEGLWNKKTARGDAALDARLVRVAERAFPQTDFSYWVKYKDGLPIAVFMAMAAEDTPFWGIPEKESLVVRTASTGTPETSGLHFWFDEAYFTKEEALKEMLGELSRWNTDFSAVVFRDFVEDGAAEWMPVFEKNGWLPVEVLELSTLTIPEQITNLGNFPSVLNSKHRYRWNQCRAALDRDRYQVEITADYLPLLDELYPLYVEVSERAEEYHAEPYPKAYFRMVKDEFGDDAVAVTIRDQQAGQYLGFMLLLYGQGGCVHQYIGFNKRDDLYLWHNLTIESIGDALTRGVRSINMGVTHAVAKRRFGAKNKKVVTFIHMIP